MSWMETKHEQRHTHKKVSTQIHNAKPKRKTKHRHVSGVLGKVKTIV